MNTYVSRLSPTLSVKLVTFLTITLLFAISFSTAHAAVTPGDPGNFITTWNTENPGVSGNSQITIPGTGTGYSYEIYWENVESSEINGTTPLVETSTYTLTFPEPGIYRVEIAGDFPRFYVYGATDKQKILTVEQWGNMAWTSMYWAFFDSINLTVPATDAPNLSGATSLQGIFFNVRALKSIDASNWNVSTITNMRSTFEGTGVMEDVDLSTWDVSNVTTMERMFTNPQVPYKDDIGIGGWNVSAVQIMHRLFAKNSSVFNAETLSDFNQDISGWDVSSATDMRSMFWNTHFNQDISGWDVSSATDMGGMFSGAIDFNQDIGGWDVSAVNSFHIASAAGGMFENAFAFDQDLSGWDISSVTNMTSMFKNAGLSQANQDAMLASFASQATTNTIENVPLHIGLKTYTEVGETAIATLESLGWTVDEQYKATYITGAGATLIGESTQSPLNNGDTTTAVEVKPNSNCTFKGWSDGNTDNPRTDVMTDNLTVTANVACSKAASQFFNWSPEVSVTSDLDTELALSSTIDNVQTFLDNPDLLSSVERTKVEEFLRLLLELLQKLIELQLQMSGSVVVE